MSVLPSPRRRLSRLRPETARLAVAACLLSSLVLCGCQSTSRSGAGTVYSYKALPTQLVASQRANSKTIDLSRLASAATNSELIDTGDVIEVAIAAGLNEKEMVKIPVRIDDRGAANLPVIGTVNVAGMEPVAAEAAIAAACVQRQLYRNPQVTVTMKRQRVNRVTVVGAVEKPGVYQIPRGSSDLLAAIVAAGGLAEDAGVQVEIRNPLGRGTDGNPTLPPIAGDDPKDVNQVGMNWSTPAVAAGSSRLESIKVDLVKATREGTGGYVVRDGGIVMVEKRDPEPVHVIGLVAKPNRYELPLGQDLRLLDAIALAGGTSSPVANRVYVIRKTPESDKTVIVNMNISEAKRDEQANLRLSPGDVVSVEQTPATVLLDALRYINIGVGGSVPLPIF